MEKKIVITKRFRNNALRVYQHLLKEYSPKIASHFLNRLEQRIEFILKNPTIGKPSIRKKNVPSVIFTPHNRLFYRYNNNVIEILCLFDMRRDIKKEALLAS